jgi:hypothetical protein
MVHALQEVHRVLVSDGVLVDVRPAGESAVVEVVSARESVWVGEARQVASERTHDHAANAALERALRDEWFRREQADRFAYSYYWDSPKEMESYIEEEWAEAYTIEAEVWARLRSAWAVADGDARLRLQLSISRTIWRQQPAAHLRAARHSVPPTEN